MEVVKKLINNHELFSYLQGLYYKLCNKAQLNKEYVKGSDYCWVLGSLVIEYLEHISALPSRYTSFGYQARLFDIPVEVDFKNKYRVTLFKDITFKL